MDEEIEIVIAGAGIAGLATSLALHKKGIKSVVLERSDYLRTSGAGIVILSNGWRGLDQLGVGSKLRQKALLLSREREVWIRTGNEREIPFKDIESRCLVRNDLVTALSENLPPNTIRLGCHIVSITSDPLTSYPIIQLGNGTSIKAKVLIGCDGANSVVADYIGLKPPINSPLSTVRGFTFYPNGHDFGVECVRLIGRNLSQGRFPINDKLIYWFAGGRGFLKDPNDSKNSELMREIALESIDGVPAEARNMIEKCDLDSLSLSQFRYRAPWDILLGKFRKGNVTVAGDAMHLMGPFLRQGGAACVEDAIVLARSLSKKIGEANAQGGSRKVFDKKVGEALDDYVGERRMRVFKLSTQTYLIGMPQLISSKVLKYIGSILLKYMFRDKTAHTRYDCGQL